MIELLTAIALWCGQPLPGFNVTAPDKINKCREELFVCSTYQTSEGRNFRATAEINNCFGKQKL